MKTVLHSAACLVVVALATGCRSSKECVVIQYGSEYMTYTGPGKRFGDACRAVLHDLSFKEELDGNRTRYPHYGEGVSSQKDGDRLIASTSYLKTKDADGAEYKVTTIHLGRRDPIVVLESTSSDRCRLVNALNAEFQKKGIAVRQY